MILTFTPAQQFSGMIDPVTSLEGIGARIGAVYPTTNFLTNARGVFSEPIAEYTMMMILAVVRRLPELLELQRERTWQPLLARGCPR
jgi:hypothetical protein